MPCCIISFRHILNDVLSVFFFSFLFCLTTLLPFGSIFLHLLTAHLCSENIYTTLHIHYIDVLSVHFYNALLFIHKYYTTIPEDRSNND